MSDNDIYQAYADGREDGVRVERARCVRVLEALRDEYAAASLPNTGIREAIVALSAATPPVGGGQCIAELEALAASLTEAREAAAQRPGSGPAVKTLDFFDGIKVSIMALRAAQG